MNAVIKQTDAQIHICETSISFTELANRLGRERHLVLELMRQCVDVAHSIPGQPWSFLSPLLSALCAKFENHMLEEAGLSFTAVQAEMPVIRRGCEKLEADHDHLLEQWDDVCWLQAQLEKRYPEVPCPEVLSSLLGFLDKEINDLIYHENQILFVRMKGLPAA